MPKPKVLVVTGCRCTFDALRVLLEARFEVESAINEEVAFGRVLFGEPDVVVIQMATDERDLQVLACLQGDDRTEGVPKILIKRITEAMKEDGERVVNLSVLPEYLAGLIAESKAVVPA